MAEAKEKLGAYRETGRQTLGVQLHSVLRQDFG
jgi:hypothetical protein